MSIFQKIKALQNTYNKWFINNSDVLSKLENGLKTTLFLFPGRFKDSEVQAETSKFDLIADLWGFDELQSTNLQFIFYLRAILIVN